MKLRAPVIILFSILMAGCATPSNRNRTGTAESSVKIVPDYRLHGRIASVNGRGQFVVVDFNVGKIPPLQTRMNVYRGNKVVGIVNLTGPVNDNLVAADIVSGEPAAGDEAIWDRKPPQARRPVEP